ncbi:hypothetical protein NEAUS03_0848 [Nematocida ausubeli]|nr:hypothetical protein NEAUS03_0848 [Nematocida ausubeli]
MNSSYNELEEAPGSPPKGPPAEKNKTAGQATKKTDLYIKFSNEDVAGLIFYHNTGGLYPVGASYSQRERIKHLAPKVYTEGDTLFIKNLQGDPLIVVSCEDLNTIRDLFWKYHGEMHRPTIEIFKFIQKKYYGIPFKAVTPWLHMCPACRNVIIHAKYQKVVQDVVKVIREPWFAICVYLVPWSDLVPVKGGYILFVMDIYSRFTLFKELPYFDTDVIQEYMYSLFMTYGVPEIAKLPGKELNIPEIINFFQETHRVQVVNSEEHPEHFISETTQAPKMQVSWLLVEMGKMPNTSPNAALKEIIYTQNFTSCEKGGKKIKGNRAPANVFFRRIVNNINRRPRSTIKKYKILRADLPSLIDLLPEDPVETKSKRHQDKKDNSTSSHQNRKRIKSDREIEAETRPSADIREHLTLYDPSHRENSRLEAPNGYSHFLEHSGGDHQKGKLVCVATPESVSKEPVPAECIEPPKILKYAKENDWPIDPPERTHLWARNMDPSKIEFLPGRYWIIKQVEEAYGHWKLYNVDTKEVITVPQDRIFEAKKSVIKESRHLISFLFKKFFNECDNSGNAQ